GRHRGRHPAGHARPARAQGAELGRDARLQHPRLAPARHARRAAHRGRRPLPRPAPHGGARADRVRVGALGEQPAGEVLPPHRGRPPRAPEGGGELAALRRHRRARARRGPAARL
ncbi:MAG: Transcriptional regulator, PadR family, partial [uncultured Gemmatimonadaceae bacterium]